METTIAISPQSELVAQEGPPPAFRERETPREGYDAFLSAIAAQIADRISSVSGSAATLRRNLVALKTAEVEFGFSRVSFWRFRKRHRIRLLPGRRVNLEDILAAFEAERSGQRRLSSIAGRPQ
jgi:hypothetical protein